MLEQAANADLMARLGLAAMVLAGTHMDAQRLVDQLQLAVIDHLGQGRAVAHMLALETHHIGMQGLVRAHLVRLRVALQQPLAQLARLQQAAGLLLQAGGVRLQIGKQDRAGHGQGQ